MVSAEVIRIQKFIRKCFDRDEIEALCFEYFYELYQDYSNSNITKTKWVNTILDYCIRTRQLDKLKRALERQNSELFEEIFTNSGVSERKIIEKPVAMEFVKIHNGQFLMGSDPRLDSASSVREQPQHRIYLSEYFIGKFPVTNQQYFQFMNSGFEGVPRHIIGWDEHPATKASWNDAQMFCRWMRSTLQSEFRLPTEAEWEKAARGTEGLIYPWGDEFEFLNLNSLESRFHTTTDIHKHQDQGMSPFGAVDMAGNVREWCLDWYSLKSYEYEARERVLIAKDPTGPSKGQYRVLRGGSFKTNQFGARCAARDNALPNASFDDVGFRVVMLP